jgi:Putative Ig domain
VVQCQETNAANSQWSPSQGFWTERSVAFKLLANVILFEVKGDSAARTRITTQTGHMIWHQNGASGTSPAIPTAGRIDGGLYHYGSQHGDGTAGAFLASSWMSVLVQDAMIRAYALTEDANVAAFIRRMGNFLRVASKSDTGHQYGGGALYYVDYMMRYDGVSDVRSTGEEEHSLEIAAALAWSWYFSELTGAADTTLKTMADNCYDAYDIGVNYWIRPTGPASGLCAYRITPWRKYGWEHRPSGSLSWLMNQSGGTSNTAPTITPIANQSVVVNTATGALAFTVGDAQDAPGALSVSASSSNTTLVPNNSANLMLSGSGASRTLTVTPATGQLGSTTITVTVQDSGSLSTNAQFTLTVTSGPTAPAFASSPLTSATVGGNYSYTITVTGTPTPNLSASGLPAWLTLSGNTLSGTPGAGDVGTAGPITISADNGVGTPAQQSFNITVVASAPGTGGPGGSGGGGGCTATENAVWWPLAVLAAVTLLLSARKAYCKV